MYSKVEEHDESPHPKRLHQRRHQGKGPKKSSEGVPPPLQPVPVDVRLKPVCGGVEAYKEQSLHPKHRHFTPSMQVPMEINVCSEIYGNARTDILNAVEEFHYWRCHQTLWGSTPMCFWYLTSLSHVYCKFSSEY